MANYYGKVRTNYFRVTDENKYLEIRRRLRGTEDSVEFWDETRNDVLYHGFGCESLVSYQEAFGTLETYANGLKESGQTWENVMIYRNCDPSGAEHETPCEISDFPEKDWSSWSIYHLDQTEKGMTRLFVSEYPENFWDSDMFTFYQKMQEILPEDEAMIITEIGNEKTCYLVGCATIVTKTQIQSVDLETYALEKAREMLKNPEFSTEMEY